MTRKVFVLSDGGHDYSGAEMFGDIVYCTNGPLKKWDVAQLYREMDEALVEAHEDDLIMIGSLTLLCSIATGVMTAAFGKVNYLLFKDGEYVEKTVVFDERRVGFDTDSL